MADIIKFEQRKRQVAPTINLIVEKLIDGKLVQFVDFELLSPSQQSQLLTANSIAHSRQ